MTSIIERVARAIAKEFEKSLLPLEIAVDWRDWVDEARAAIEAMREPTEEMIVAGVQTHEGVTFSGILSYHAMIGVALKEQP